MVAGQVLFIWKPRWEQQELCLGRGTATISDGSRGGMAPEVPVMGSVREAMGESRQEQLGLVVPPGP